MAIPFNLPSDDTTLDQYRSIHQLLLDLTAILRSLLARNPEWIRPDGSSPNAATNNNNNNHDDNNNDSGNVNNNTSSRANASRHCVHHHNCTLQFGLPLSPPNSQPGSPSPFFTSATASSGSVFVLPDVVSNAARTLNELTPHQMVPSVANNAEDSVPHQTVRNQQQYDDNNCAPISQTLRKRKRGTRLVKRKCKPHDLDLGARKIPKTVSCSCFCDAATDSASHFVDQMHMRMEQQHQQQQVFCPDVPTLSDTMPCNCNQSSPPDCRIPPCVHVSEELRKIVECFRSPRKINEVNGDTISSNDEKVSFFTHFGRTMFTAALLVVGWKLLKQN